MSIAEEYKKSLKMVEAEEILDLLIYRPIAFIIVKLIYRLPVTPNQMTYASLVAGLLAAFEFAQGTAIGFLWGAVWYAIANILDCGDGMLARLQKSGTPLGRIIDGIIDWISSVAIFFGLGMGMTAHFNNPWYWILAVAAGIFSGYHAMVFDKRQQEYISTVRGERNFIERESERVESELGKSSNALRKLVLSIYASYMKVQERNSSNEENVVQYEPEMYRRHSMKIMRWWTWLGSTTNRTLLILAGVLARPDWFCWVILLPVNFYLIFMFLWQRKVTHGLEQPTPATPPQATTQAA